MGQQAKDCLPMSGADPTQAWHCCTILHRCAGILLELSASILPDGKRGGLSSTHTVMHGTTHVWQCTASLELESMIGESLFPAWL